MNIVKASALAVGLTLFSGIALADQPTAPVAASPAVSLACQNHNLAYWHGRYYYGHRTYYRPYYHRVYYGPRRYGRCVAWSKPCRGCAARCVRRVW